MSSPKHLGEDAYRLHQTLSLFSEYTEGHNNQLTAKARAEGWFSITCSELLSATGWKRPRLMAAISKLCHANYLKQSRAGQKGWNFLVT